MTDSDPLAGLESKGNRVVVTGHERIFNAVFNKDNSFFMDGTNIKRLVNKTKYIIRGSKEYSYYKSYLLNEAGLTTCAIFGAINKEMGTLEMHHGPILAIDDYIEITLASFLNSGRGVNSLAIAHQVMLDHKDNLIQVVMLCKNAHLAADNDRKHHNDDDRFFIPLETAWGDLVSYLKKYKNSVSRIQLRKILRYLDREAQYKKDRNLAMGNHYTTFREFITHFDTDKTPSPAKEKT
jgi:hypothetical protein